MQNSGFQKAQRSQTNPTIALMGPTGSGKTFSAMKLASGIAIQMGKPFAVIDTENGSASLYSDFFEFDTLSITPPFTTEKYIEAINLAEKNGYCAIIIDSITHAWAGEGGLLEQKAILDSRPGANTWANWNPIKAKDLKFKNAYLHSTIPFLIATMRSKMEYAQTEKDNKKKIEKMGMAPVQADGIEYEFSLVLDIAMNHEAEVTKDRTHLFKDNKIFKVTEQIGEMLVQWRNSGKQMAIEPKLESPIPMSLQLDKNRPQNHGAIGVVESKSASGGGGTQPPVNKAAPSKVLNQEGYFIYPFGANKGKFLKDIPVDWLEQSYDWCTSNGGEQKHGRLMKAIIAWLDIVAPAGSKHQVDANRDEFEPPPEYYNQEPPLFDETEEIP